MQDRAISKTSSSSLSFMRISEPSVTADLDFGLSVVMPKEARETGHYLPNAEDTRTYLLLYREY